MLVCTGKPPAIDWRATLEPILGVNYRKSMKNSCKLCARRFPREGPQRCHQRKHYLLHKPFHSRNPDGVEEWQAVENAARFMLAEIQAGRIIVSVVYVAVKVEVCFVKWDGVFVCRRRKVQDSGCGMMRRMLELDGHRRIPKE